jgi:hypothetical protein
VTRLGSNPTEENLSSAEAAADAPTETTATVESAAASRGRQLLVRILVALIARQAEEDGARRRRALLEHRIAEVRRAFGSALDDGREIERRFRQIAETMTIEEREEFFRGFLASCGTVLGTAGNEMRDVFVESVRHGVRQTNGRRD